jgi:septal ring factor EnvC (AmiA/AmiB activator)
MADMFGGGPLRRDHWIAAGVFVMVALVATAYADNDEPQAQPRADATPAPVDARGRLAQQLGDESETIDRALTTVLEKLAAADAARARRLAAAYRMMRVPVHGDAMGAARRLAAARLLIARDVAERGLLANEAEQLRAAATRTTTDAQRVPTIALPDSIKKPAQGPIIRSFGPYAHERSKTVLSRRGIDIEVDARAPVSAPADGTVRYAGPIRGLDGGVILDHGDYWTVLGKLGEIAVPVGAHVARGDRLGRAAQHRVYLEVRVKLGPGGLPIDPEPLLREPR